MFDEDVRVEARAQVGLTRQASVLLDPECPAHQLSETAGRYRIHLERHPGDEAAWEDLGLVHRRLADGEHQADSEHATRAAHLRLAFECERRALALRPRSLRLRHRLLRSLGAALAEAGRDEEGLHAALLTALGGVQATQRVTLDLIDETLARYEDRPREQGGWLCDGLRAWRSRLLCGLERPATGPAIVPPQGAHALLERHLDALNRGDLKAAGRELDALEVIWDSEDAAREAGGEPPLHHGRPRLYRLLLLEAQDRRDAALALARREADLLASRPDDRHGLDRAALLEYAGEQATAVTLLEGLAGRPGEARQAALEQLARIRAGGRLEL